MESRIANVNCLKKLSRPIFRRKNVCAMFSGLLTTRAQRVRGFEPLTGPWRILPRAARNWCKSARRSLIPIWISKTSSKSSTDFFLIRSVAARTSFRKSTTRHIGRQSASFPLSSGAWSTASTSRSRITWTRFARTCTRPLAKSPRIACAVANWPRLPNESCAGVSLPASTSQVNDDGF